MCEKRVGVGGFFLVFFAKFFNAQFFIVGVKSTDDGLLNPHPSLTDEENVL